MTTTDAETPDETHVFTAVEKHPTGIQVTTTIRVPRSVSVLWDIRDCGEVAQMAASRAMSQALKLREESEEVPF